MLGIDIILAIRDKTNDPNFPVLMEIESRQPGYRRRQITTAIALIVWLAVSIFFWLRGWELAWVP
jgi:hypothetical protein